MKREIKFRAWDKVHECYLYDVQGAYDMLSGCVKYENGEDAVYDEECFAGFLDNDQYVVEQYTGLHDKNGRKIYEGDIVRCDRPAYHQNPNFKVEDWVYGKLIMRDVPQKGYGTSFWSNGDDIEVIGNIFNDPELLDGKQ